MARRKSKLEVQGDGALSLGIHKILPPAKPSPVDEESLRQWVDRLNRSACDYIAELRPRFAEIVLPHITGPLSDSEARNEHFTVIDFGDGPRLFLLKPYMRLHSNNRPEHADAIAEFEKLDDVQRSQALQAMDAIEALDEIRVIEMHLGPDANLDWLFRKSFRLGWLCKQLQIRPFERAVKIGLKKSRKSAINAMNTNKKRAARQPDYPAAVRARMKRGIKYTPACQQVANLFDVTKETVRNNTPELRPRRKQK